MAESLQNPKHIEVRSFKSITPKKEKQKEGESLNRWSKSDPDALYKVVHPRRRRSRSLTDLEIQQEFKPFSVSTDNKGHVIEDASDSITVEDDQPSNTVDAAELQNRHDQLEKRLYKITTSVGIVLIFLIAILAGIFIRKDIDEGNVKQLMFNIARSHKNVTV